MCHDPNREPTPRVSRHITPLRGEVQAWRFGGWPCGKDHPSFWRWWVVIVCVLALPTNNYAETNVPGSAHILSVQGKVDALVEPRRFRASAGMKLLPGQGLETGQYSSAGLRWHDGSDLQVGEATTIYVPVVPPSGKLPFLEVLKGRIFFFHRNKPGSLEIKTPSAWAAVRGTEFTLEVSANGTTKIWMIDGEADLFNNDGHTSLGGGFIGIVEPGAAPRTEPYQEARNRFLQWFLYYPSVLDLDDLPWKPEPGDALKKALTAYKEGDLGSALDSWPEGYTPSSPSESVFRGAMLAAGGHPVHAAALLNTVDASNAQEFIAAQAVLSLISVVQDDAPMQDNRATDFTPASHSALLAESWRLQKVGKLEAAFELSRRLTMVAPSFGIGWARRAELAFSFGHIEEASNAIDTSLRLSPKLAHAWVLSGFLKAARYQWKAARETFENALNLDPRISEGWLGTGLLSIREGFIREGLSRLQTAAALQPSRAILRSYLGKAFAEANDPEHATNELRIARILDPQDPTAWFYSALLLQESHQYNNSVRELERSIERNDNRALVRSKLLLDTDNAARGTSLARVFQQAGLEEPARREAAKAVMEDYTSHAAHLFLAESYNELRDPTRFNLQYETVWFNELLMANLLSPPGAGLLSQNVSQQEYTRLFERNQLHLSTLSEVRSDGQWRESATQFGQHDRFAYAIDIDAQHVKGPGINQTLDRTDCYSTIKYQLSPSDSLLLLTKLQDYHAGDNRPQGSVETEPRPDLKISNTQAPLAALGWHREWTPESHTLTLAGRLENDAKVTDIQSFHWLLVNHLGELVGARAIPADEVFRSQWTLWFSELCHIWRLQKQTLVVGGRAQTGAFESESLLSRIPPVHYPVSSQENRAEEGFHRLSSYVYDLIELTPTLKCQLGLAFDSVKFPGNFRQSPVGPGELTRTEALPKAALLWNLTPKVAVRAMHAWSLSGASFDESFRLEPAQLAGFAQSFRAVIPESVVGSVSGQFLKTWGTALDWKVKEGTYLGLEMRLTEANVQRNNGALMDYTTGTQVDVLQFPQSLDHRSTAVGLGIHQLLGDEWSAGTGARFHNAKLTSLAPSLTQLDPDNNYLPGPRSATLKELWTHLQWQHPHGPFARAESVCLWQGHANRMTLLEGEPETHGHTFTSQVNLLAGWKFHSNRGELSAGVLNVGDTRHHIDPLSGYPDLPQARVFVARLKLNF